MTKGTVSKRVKILKEEYPQLLREEEAGVDADWEVIDENGERKFKF